MKSGRGSRREAVRPYFAGVIIEGVPGGGTMQEATRLVSERLVRHVLANPVVPPPVPTEEAAD